MLRSSLIYLSKSESAKHVVTNWKFVWKAASRFIAGSTLADGINAVRELNKKGIYATLDHLGEHIHTEEEAKTATQDVIQIFEAIVQSGVMANVSIKLTQIGLTIDPQLCIRNYARIVQAAQQSNQFLRIDMEDSSCVDITLKIVNTIHAEYGYEGTGVVIQAYLYRSADDIARLIDHGIRVRLCKGAYKEPASVAYPAKKDVDKNFDRLAAQLIDGSLCESNRYIQNDGHNPPLLAVATHDPARIEYAVDYARKAGLEKSRLEFQMLYGIRRDLQESMQSQGYPVRVYVPYGTQWYPYFVRRLAERPANIWFFISNYFRK
jgi:proline dehydrogenase